MVTVSTVGGPGVVFECVHCPDCGWRVWDTVSWPSPAPGPGRSGWGRVFFFGGGGDSVLKINFFALSVFFFFCGFGCADPGRPVLLCATGMEHGHGRGGGESLICDPGREFMKRRHSACALQPETELEKKKKTAAFPPSGSLASIRTTYVDIPNRELDQ